MFQVETASIQIYLDTPDITIEYVQSFVHGGIPRVTARLALANAADRGDAGTIDIYGATPADLMRLSEALSSAALRLIVTQARTEQPQPHAFRDTEALRLLEVHADAESGAMEVAGRV